MKRTSTVICFSAMVLISSVLAVGNAIAFENGGTIDKFFSKGQDFNGENVEEALTQGKDLAQEIAQNGDVLLKNENNTLPLTSDGDENIPVNIFGWGASDNGFLYQGGGSSEGGYSADKISFYDAFRNDGFDINESLVSAYNGLSYRREGGPDRNQHSIYYRTYEPDQSFYSSDLMTEAANFSQTAIMVFSRRATEGDDLPKVSYDEQGNADTSRNYLALTAKEELMVEQVASNFENVICVFNTPAPMEMGFLNDERIDAAIWIGYPGYYGTTALPAILKGDINPSGHMVDTSAYRLDSSPTYVNSGPDATHAYNGQGGNYKDYAEDIYSGYRWYETADAEGYFDETTREINGETVSGYYAVVQYPFGYGLSYTTFDWDLESVYKLVENPEDEEKPTEVDLGSGNIELNPEDTLRVKVWVENTGDVAGKEAVQLYAHSPYTKGGIEKAEVVLIAFDKTASLEPGQGQYVNLDFKVSDLASYDTYDKNNNGHMGYELEQGLYELSLRTDAHEVKKDPNGNPLNISAKVSVDGGHKITTDSTTGNEVKNRFTTYENTTSGAKSECYEPQTLYPLSIDGNDKSSDYNQGITYLTRSDFAGTFPKATAQRSMSENMYKNVFKVHDPINDPDDKMPKTGSTDTNWQIQDVMGLAYEDEKWDELVSQLTIEELQTLSARGGFGTYAINRIGKGACVDSDGGTGFTSGVVSGDGGHAIKYPAANVLGSTWDVNLAYKWGHSIGEEGKALNIQGWYAPGCNIHRSPLGGRNFEYFAEDGLLAGRFVANTVEACTENGVYAYIKHFAANDTDEGRNGQFIWMTEQSLRELWAKPGEVATKEGKANAMMVSVDRVGATRATGSYALLTSLLRDEWGFRGSTITDYYQSGDVNDLDEGIRAGNDLALLPGGNPDVFADYKNPSATSVIALQNAAHNILYTYADMLERTRNFTGKDLSDELGQRTEDESGKWWRYALYGIDAAIGVSFVAWAAVCIYFTWVKPNKDTKEEQ